MSDGGVGGGPINSSHAPTCLLGSFPVEQQGLGWKQRFVSYLVLLSISCLRV